jgi:phage terminase small subunit
MKAKISKKDIVKSKLREMPIGRQEDLTAEQELFCQLYATSREYFGNGTQTYIEAYDMDTSKPNYYKTAMASASRLLRNVKILARIRELMETSILNDEFVDKELSFLIEQNSELGTKLGAIKEYNNLKARIQNKLDLTSKGEKLDNFDLGKLTDEQLTTLAGIIKSSESPEGAK